jgi:hypothetical protein
MAWVGWAIVIAGILIGISTPVTITRLTDTTFVIGTQFGWRVCDATTMTCKSDSK